MACEESDDVRSGVGAVRQPCGSLLFLHQGCKHVEIVEFYGVEFVYQNAQFLFADSDEMTFCGGAESACVTLCHAEDVFWLQCE